MFHGSLNHQMYISFRILYLALLQKKGPWTEEEQILFISLLGKYGPGNWGVFSTHIPGRVGFQCAEFYRELVKSGLITPDNSLLESMDSEYNNYMGTPTGSQVKSNPYEIEKKTLQIQSHFDPSQNNSHTKTKLEDTKLEATKLEDTKFEDIKLEDTKFEDQNFIDKEEDNPNEDKEKKVVLKKKTNNKILLPDDKDLTVYEATPKEKNLPNKRKKISCISLCYD